MVVTESLTNVNAFALLMLAAAIFAVLWGRPQTAAVTLLLAALLIPFGQQFVVFGLHIRFFRLLILVGLCRTLVRGELRSMGLTTIDRLMLAWALTGVLCGLWRGARAETFGVAYDALGTYFLLRALFVDSADLVVQLRFLALVGVLLCGSMAYELATHHNPLHVFGGVPEITYVRDGRFRCQGPFRHPILAGTFAASLAPLLVGLWLQVRIRRLRVALCLAACAFCTFAAASSGALLTLLGGVVGFALWPARHRLRLFRRGAIAVIVVLALVMNAPVWYLIARISDLTGGTGWHRSFLIDLAVEHFGDWWLTGFAHTLQWAPASWQDAPGTSIDPDNLDITNHYLQQGLSGGLLQLGLFIAIITVCFRTVGRVLRSGSEPALDPRLVWALGVCLAAHCMAFISVSYFDQIQVFWFWLLAVIATLARRWSAYTERSASDAATAGEDDAVAVEVETAQAA